jgi:hypothetical protein
MHPRAFYRSRIRGASLAVMLVLVLGAGSTAYQDPAAAPGRSHRFPPKVEPPAVGSEEDPDSYVEVSEDPDGKVEVSKDSYVDVSEDPEYVDGPESEPFPGEASSRPPLWNDAESFGIGACLGRGAGLFGAYLYFRPSDQMGLEFDLGARLLTVSVQGLGPSRSNLYWPMGGAAKLQFFFEGRRVRSQTGLAVGLLMAEDAGTGAALTYFSHTHLSRGLCFDAEIGLGTYPSIQSSTQDYLKHTVGPGYRFEVPSTPIFLMWGLGLSGAF